MAETRIAFFRKRPSEPPPPAEPVALLLRLLSNASGRGGEAETLGTPEAASAYAERLDLDLTPASRKAEALRPQEFPAIVLTGAGGRLLTARRGREFEARGSGGPYRIDARSLRADELGSAFLVAPRRQAEKAASDDAGLEGVYGHIWTRSRGLMLQLMLAAAFSNLMLLALPTYTGLVYDRVIPHSALDTLWAVSLGVTLALAGDLAMRAVRQKLQDAVASSASAAIQASLMRRMLEARMLDAPRMPSALTMHLQEVDSLSQLVPAYLTGVMIDAPFLLLVFGLVWLNGGPIVFAPVFGLTALFALHRLAAHFAKGDQARATRLAQAQTATVIEAVESLELVKLTRTERVWLTRFERLFDQYAYASHIGRFWQALGAYANVSVGQFMIVLVMLIGVYRVSQGEMTLGGLSSCSLLVGRIIGPIGQLIVVIHRMSQSRAKLRSLAGAGPQESESAGDRSGALGAPLRAEIRFERVSFSYPGQSAPQLSEVSFTIRPGERVAIIGRSGSGKSTLLKLSARLFDPDRGALLIDDVNARQYAPADLRGAIGLMSQSAALIDDTLLGNLTLGTFAATPEEIQAVARLTGVADYASRHPQGFGMRVGPRGERLSGGERQSAALARLLLSRPKALLLDEPTAAMDTMLEMRFVREFRAWLGDRTLIVATHRAPILELVDRLIWMDGGRVMADGPKAEVMRRMSGQAA